MKRMAWGFTAAHGLALTVGLFGILVAIPHPELWSHDPNAAAFYAFAINRTGGTGMFLGTFAMLAYGFWALGARRTIAFFVAATVISAAAELIGTKTGWPFGGYEYTSFLGPKLFGRVPVAIPLSWFYMGFAAYALADAIAARFGVRDRAWRRIVIATLLLAAWDLVLDPSMAAPQLQYVHFWIWHETGPYFGMPLRNLAGWLGTSFLFIAVGDTLGRPGLRDAGEALPPLALPFTVYVINIVWSAILSVSAGLWPTAIAAIVCSLLPAALALRAGRLRTATA